MNYPAGVELIENGRCPLGAATPMACMFCSCGHMLECHYPMSCAEANCSHYQAEHGPEFSADPDPVGAGPDSGFSPEDLPVLLVCEFCGCDQFNPCPGGCDWSDRYIEQGRAVCTQCEGIAIAFDVNWGAFNAWLAGMENLIAPCRNND
ncbi:MAG: hypothetical protein JXR49_02640 [Acidobacteria bacterium]|nr:hypothetical protein [Acidobacteriota bacterium]